MNEGLFSAFSGLKEWNDLLERVRAPGITSVYNVAEGERAFTAAALANRTGRCVLLVSPTELIAQKQAQDAAQLLGGQCAMLPAREIQFSRAAASRESTWQRLSVLEDVLCGKIKVLCVSAEGLMSRYAPVRLFRNAAVTLSEGGRIAPQTLLESLLFSGYERVDMVEGKGQCSLRGSILDVYPPSADSALRVEFFDDELDSLREFDPISQRSIRRVKSAKVGPASEALIDPDAREQSAVRLRDAITSEQKFSPSIGKMALEKEGDLADLPPIEEIISGDGEDDEEQNAALELHAQALLSGEKGVPATARDNAYKRHLDDVDVVRRGYPTRTGSMWMNVLHPQTASLFDYLENPILLLDAPDQLQVRAKARQEGFVQDFGEAQRRGDAFDAQLKLLYTYDELVQRLTGRAVVTLGDLQRGMGQVKPEVLLDFGSSPVMPYQSQLKPLCGDIAQWKEKGFCIALLAGGEARGRRLERALSELDTPCVYTDSLPSNLIAREALILPITLSKGFVHEKARLAVVSDADIYGSSYQRAKHKYSAGERIASFTDLKVGDYVVHESHGVGIYQGVTQMSSDGVKRDYLLLQYAGNDKLYVPTDQFDRVQRFIGAEHAAPKLNRLGGNEWQRQKSKVKAGLKKLAFDLVALYAKRQSQTGYAFSHETPWQREFEDLFPYELTPDQQQSVAQIENDMERPINMDRLLCGDVGYGKTEVALRAAFKAVVEGKQVAILAPTTILVQQHFRTVEKRFAGFPIKCDMLSRFKSPKEQKEILQRLKEGKIDLIVGTHRLLAKDVQFHDLGLLIVDEEHRFGVAHKESIKNLKTKVDVLTLSATPIPRTLHMSMVGIRDMSLLETPPEERLPVKTFVMEYNDGVIRDAIRRELARGGQVYFLYNRVRSIEQMYDRLKTLVPEARVGIAHGQMRDNSLEDVMLDFYAGAYDVLLCTTIIENGLDVPEANTLIVFDADRFGLSQLYQIRGRVGRSSRQAYAYFTIRKDKVLSETAEKRLSAIREFTEFGAGYRIAMRDLEIRGAGDVLGPEQHGHLSTVGYDMYLKLIEQTVAEVQGKEDTPELDTRVELSVDAYLPEDYVCEERLRVEIYKRIAMVEDENSRMDIEEELIDRFGDLPEPVHNLTAIAQLRAITRRLAITHLFLRADGVHMRIDPTAMPDPMVMLAALGQTDSRLAFSQKQPPELVLRQAGLTAQSALPLCIQLLSKVLGIVKERQKQRNPSQEPGAGKS